MEHTRPHGHLHLVWLQFFLSTGKVKTWGRGNTLWKYSRTESTHSIHLLLCKRKTCITLVDSLKNKKLGFGVGVGPQPIFTSSPTSLPHMNKLASPYKVLMKKPLTSSTFIITGYILIIFHSNWVELPICSFTALACIHKLLFVYSDQKSDCHLYALIS